MTRHAARIVVIPWILGAMLPAQEVLWQVSGVKDVVSLGSAQAFDDLDRDGYEDLLVDARYTYSGGTVYDATHFLSGRDGSTLRVAKATLPNVVLTTLARAGDMDADGIQDYARTSSDGSGRQFQVTVYSGKDDRVLWQQTSRIQFFGRQLIGDLDVNGDRRPDLLVFEWPWAVHAFDHGGNLLYKKVVSPLQLESIGKLGDFDLDGCDDFLAGSVNALTGAVFVHSGRTGAVVATAYGLAGDSLGLAVLGCGDMDRDGVVDFMGSGWLGAVRVFSGRTSQVVHGWTTNVQGVGQYLSAGDLDLDGISDLLVSDPNPVGAAPAYQWYSLRDGALVTTLLPPPAIVRGYGGTASVGRPQPGSPFPTIAAWDAGTALTTLGPIGRISLLRSLPPGVKALGAPCAGTLATAPVLGFRDLGSTSARLHLTGAPTGATAFLVAGLSSTSWGGLPLPLSLTPAGFPGCLLTTSVDAYLVTAAGTSGVNAGFAWVDVPKLTAPLHGQWIVAGAGPTWPGGVTEGLQW